MKAFNHYVPLSDVSEYSDVVTFGEMGLPVGFDVDRLAANVGVLEKVAHYGNIGQLSIVGFRGDVTEETYTVGGSYSDGTSTAVGSAVVSRAALHEHELDGNSSRHRFGYDWKRATVRVNNAEIEDRIKRDGDKWELGVYDPEARLRYTNKALVSGLQAAAKHSIFEERGARQTAMRALVFPVHYGVWKYFYGFSGDPLTAVTAATPALEAGLNHLLNTFRDQDRSLPKRQWSILNFPQYDRYLATTTLLRTSRILKLVPTKSE